MWVYIIAAAIGFGLGIAFMLAEFKVMSKETWEAHRAMDKGLTTCCTKLVAENAKLRVALAASEMTDEGKKVAALTMAALGVVEDDYSGAPDAEEYVRFKAACLHCNQPEDAPDGGKP